MVIIVARLCHVPYLKLSVMEQFFRTFMLNLHRYGRLRLLFCELNLLWVHVHVLLLLVTAIVLFCALVGVECVALNDHSYLLSIFVERVP